MAQVLGLAPAGSPTTATGTGGTTGAAGAKGVGPGSNDTSNVFVTNGTMNYTAFGGSTETITKAITDWAYALEYVGNISVEYIC